MKEVLLIIMKINSEVKKKIQEIANQTVSIFDGNTPFIRFSFVGYKDHGDADRFHVLDFVNYDRAAEFSQFVIFHLQFII